MARLVRHDADAPQNLPFCDGAHKACKSEDAGTVYVYDTERSTVVETRPAAE
jgi:CDGSH-type Zn-finger protein